MTSSSTVKHLVQKAIRGGQDKRQFKPDDCTSFDSDAKTLVNVPIRSALISPNVAEEPVDIRFVEDLVWGPAPSSYDGENRNILSLFSRRR